MNGSEALNFTLDAFTLSGNYSTAPDQSHIPEPMRTDTFSFTAKDLTSVHADIDKSYACVTGNTVINVEADRFALLLDALQMQVNRANVTTFAQGERVCACTGVSVCR
jgi:hypothetical protein